MNRISEGVNIAVCGGVALLILLAVGIAEGASDNELNLLELAKEIEEFGELREAEEKLFRKVVHGELADCSDKSGRNNNPSRAEEWDKNTRVIRAECITWLCTDQKASAMVTHKGIHIKGARIDGKLDLSYAEITFPLRFEGCMFPNDVNLQQATIQALDFSGTHTRSIEGKGLKVDGDVHLRDGFKAEGMVELKGATIGGYLDCTGGKFINRKCSKANCVKDASDRKNIALEATGVKVSGNVNFCEDFVAVGVVSLYGAEIGRELDCKGGTFRNPDWVALNGDQMEVGGSVYLAEYTEKDRNKYREFSAEGEVRLLGATIGGDLDCERGAFINTGADALSADGLKVVGDVFLCDDFKAEGEVRLLGAAIGGNLNCKRGAFINTGADALSADGLKVGGDVFLWDGFKAEGQVRLIGATIGGDLDCTNGAFINRKCSDANCVKDENDRENVALEATGVKVGGNVSFCEDFEAVGVVSLYGAEIGRELDCKGGTFRNPGWVAFNGDQMKVEGNVFLSVKENSKDPKDCFTAQGQVRLIGATIGGNLDCCNGEFVNKQEKYPESLNTFDATRVKVGGDVLLGDNDKQKRFRAEGIVKLYNAEINGRFSWWNVDSAEAVEELDLRFAKIGTLNVEAKSDRNPREEERKLLLHGLVYDEIGDESLTSNNMRLNWLRRQIKFQPQPYEQLAAVLRKGGRNADAKDILVAKAKDRARHMSPFERSLHWFLGLIIGYGYRPWRALWWILVFLISGCIIFGFSHKKLMSKAKDKTREEPEESGFFPKFNPWMYSLDVFVPMVNLRQENYWMPDANKGPILPILLKPELFTLRLGGLLRGYMWFHIVAGWVLSTLLVVGLTGLVKG